MNLRLTVAAYPCPYAMDMDDWTIMEQLPAANPKMPREVSTDTQPPAQRQPGALRGQIRMAPDFDMLPGDVLAAMEG